MSPLTESANGALASALSSTTLLIMVQLISRLFIFTSNQMILRNLSPSILGVAAQLELYMISILYFSRESIRIGIQRQPVQPNCATLAKKDQKIESSHEERKRIKTQIDASQSVVNMSYLSLAAGIPLAIIFSALYVHVASDEILQIPFYHKSVLVTAVASLIELGIEPFFTVVQRHTLYKKRAVVEISAAFMKTTIVCGLYLWAAWRGHDLGALPFALGYLGYSFVLICGYSIAMMPVAREGQFSFLLTPIESSDGSKFLAGRFSWQLISLSANVFLQSVVKHLLTQGDSMMLAAMTSLEDQGIYSLASNYGGLVARILFQPIEESSRTIFSSLLNTNRPESLVADIKSAKMHLVNILRGYIILSSLVFPLAPALVPRMLHILGGRRWASPEVDGLLALYCYYIPFLAFNGISEAFVSSAANPTELRKQSVWMGLFSACFAVAAYVFLRVGGLGARGLVYANIVNMAVRIVWSFSFIQSYLYRYNCALELDGFNMHIRTYVAGLIVALLLSGKIIGHTLYDQFGPFIVGIMYSLFV